MKATYQYQFDVILRNDKESRWLKWNPILRPGELVVSISESDAGYKFKLGDGVTPYKDLPFVPFEEGLDKGCVFAPYAGGMAKITFGPLAKYNIHNPEVPPSVDAEEFDKIINTEQREI